MRRVDLNSDVGEGAGADERVVPQITSANIACGAHAGDLETMRATVRLAMAHRVAVGAHPGHRDPANFGRVPLDVPQAALFADLVAQIEALQGVADEAGARMTHVKAHGALYNQAWRDTGIAAAIAGAVRSVGSDLVLFAAPGSALETAARSVGLRVAREGFADRAYERDGTLRSRRLPGAVHEDPARAAEQAVSLARDGMVRAFDGSILRMEVDTLCVHGDSPGAPEIARAVREALTSAGIGLAPMSADAPAPLHRAPSVE